MITLDHWDVWIPQLPFSYDLLKLIQVYIQVTTKLKQKYMSFIKIQVRNIPETCYINLLMKDSIFKKFFLKKINLKFVF